MLDNLKPTPLEIDTDASKVKEIEALLGPFTRDPMAPASKPVTMIVSGPSGVGKDSVVSRLREMRPDLHFVVTATSRAMREGERDGVDYHFVSRNQFERWIADDQLLEHAVVYGEYKGIPKPQIEDALAHGKDVVLRLDVQGAATVRKLLPHVVSVYIVAASEAELVRRLVHRKTESEQALIKRVGTIRRECERMHEFQYIVVNREGGLENAAADLAAIIDAERLRLAQP